MSANDRAAYMSAPRPRAVSNRVDSETRGPSPLQVENKDPLRHSTSSQKHGASRDQKSMSEKRQERMVVTSREKAVRTRQLAEAIGIGLGLGSPFNSTTQTPVLGTGIMVR